MAIDVFEHDDGIVHHAANRDGQFDVVFGVTVLQHILDPELLRAAVRGMTGRLAPGCTLPPPAPVFPRYVEPEPVA